MHVGFDRFKDQVTVEQIRIIGSDQKGNNLTARTVIAIENPSNVSLLWDESPIEISYQGVKVIIQAVSHLVFPLTHNQIAYFTMPVNIDSFLL